MHVALIGATGPVGSRILEELVSRQHEVTAVVRDVSRVPARAGVSVAAADIHDLAPLTTVLSGHDAVISAVRFLKSDVETLLAAVKGAGVTRYLVVGGAASLYAVGTTTKLIDSGVIPEAYLPEPSAGVRFFERLKQERELDWTFLSPSMMFSNDPEFGLGWGGRSGRYRLGLDELLVAEDGTSAISYEDYAKAMVDELEQPRHSRRRFTVGY